MNIAFDLRCLDNPYGGIPRYAENLARALIAIDKRNNYLLLTHGRAPKFALKESDSVMVKNLDWPNSAYVDDELKLPQLLEDYACDLYYNPAFVCPSIQVCASVITVHDIAFALYPWHYPAAFVTHMRVRLGASVQAADAIITPSHATAVDVTRCFPVGMDNITVIPEAPDEIFKPTPVSGSMYALKKKFGINKPFILAVGVGQPRKNFETLLDAFLITRSKTRKDILLVAAGNYEEFISHYPEKVPLLKTDFVKMLGFVADTELAALYANAVCLVFTSRYEGFGLPILEAFASGTPVIISDTPSCKEVAGECALVVDGKNSHETAEAILKILRGKKTRETLIKNGIARARQFSWRKTAEATLTLFERIVNHRKEVVS